MISRVWILILALACGGKEGEGGGGSDSAAPEEGPAPAELAPISEGACPAMDSSGTSSFSSGGLERNVTILIPAEPREEMPLVFFFHGLADPGSTPEPGAYFAEALDLQSVADEYGVIIALPDSRTMEIATFSFYMWQVAEEDDLDLVLYDDLRSCLAGQWPIDLRSVHAMGFSGGALFTTVVMRERADTLASAVEFSGGSDIVTPFFENPLSRYATPAWALPVLLATGGETDVWPNQTLTVVDFVAATDALQEQLVADESYVVRCRHERGHTVTQQEYNLGIDWVLAHRYGEVSPYLEAGLGDDTSWCEIPEAGATD
jgi:poly(3-hydroxybutyrate) depolymerase